METELGLIRKEIYDSLNQLSKKGSDPNGIIEDIKNKYEQSMTHNNDLNKYWEAFEKNEKAPDLTVQKS